MIAIQYFCNKRGGTYVEMGALDGLLFTNTKLFEESMGWTGVLIEANPANVERLIINRPGKPQNHIFPMAACAEGIGNLTFTGGRGGVGGVVQTMSPSHMRRWNFKAPSFSVPCEPLGRMLNKAGKKHVDFFSLDVEGAELAVLETMDWNITVCLWLVELSGLDPEKDEAVRQLLRAKGYTTRSWEFKVMCQGLLGGSVAPSGGICHQNELFLHKSFSTCGVNGAHR